MLGRASRVSLGRVSSVALRRWRAFSADFGENTDVRVYEDQEPKGPPITINFILEDGSRKTVQASQGQSVLDAATAHNVPVPYSDFLCGAGSNMELHGEGPSCPHCHCFVPVEFHDSIPKESDPEGQDYIYPYMRVKTTSNSRIACAIPVTPEIDGITVAFDYDAEPIIT